MLVLGPASLDSTLVAEVDGVEEGADMVVMVVIVVVDVVGTSGVSPLAVVAVAAAPVVDGRRKAWCG